MIDDPIVNEIRRNGAKVAAECGNDIRRIAERLRREQAAHGHRVRRIDRRPKTDRLARPPGGRED